MNDYRQRAAAEADEIKKIKFTQSDGFFPKIEQMSVEQKPNLIRDDNWHFPQGRSYLKYGFRALSGYCRQKALAASDSDTIDFYWSISIVYETLAGKMEEYANSVSDTDTNSSKIKETFFRLAYFPPKSFRDAICMEYVFYHIRSVFGSCIGLLDRHLKPFFENDINTGNISEEEAVDLLKEFYSSINEVFQGDTLANVMAGGMDADGNDASSRLSVLMLKAGMETKGSEPHLNVRYHSKLRQDLFDTMVDMQLQGKGNCTFYNDEAVIPELIKWGFSKEDAAAYTNDGCTEIIIDGRTPITFTHIDTVAVVELTLNNGSFSDFPRKKFQDWGCNGILREAHADVIRGYQSGTAEDCSSYEEFFGMFIKQYLYQVENYRQTLLRVHNDISTNSIGSMLLNGSFFSVLESGKSMYKGALLPHYMIFAGSIPTAADCLAAIKQKVFTEHKYTIAEIKQALLANFKGYEDMQAELKACSKFGNNGETDTIAAEISNIFYNYLWDKYQEGELKILPALIGWKFLEEAYAIGPTPDGRNYADPIAEHYNATPGNAKNGPTAIINAISKAPRCPGVTASHITLPAGKFEGKEGRDIMAALNKAAIAKGIMYLNFGIYNKETLLKAQQNPADYPDLVVRVWGFSSPFALLSKEMQDHVISRL